MVIKPQSSDTVTSERLLYQLVALSSLYFPHVLCSPRQQPMYRTLIDNGLMTPHSCTLLCLITLLYNVHLVFMPLLAHCLLHSCWLLSVRVSVHKSVFSKYISLLLPCVVFSLLYCTAVSVNTYLYIHHLTPCPA